MKTILAITAIVLLMLIVGCFAYVAGKASGFSDYYNLTHPDGKKGGLL